MKKYEKREIKTDFDYIIDKYQFEGDLDEIIKKLKNTPKKLAEMYPLNETIKDFHRYSIRVDSETEYYSNDSHDIYILEGWRWETDEEFSKRRKASIQEAKERVKRAEEEEISKAKREKTLYENLKKKFETKKSK